MSISDLRRENLRSYIKENFKTRAEFADKIGKSASQVAMWFMKSDGKRDIGEKLAREIESALNLPNGWMDNDHNQGEIVLSPEQQELVSLVNQLSNEDAIKAVRIIKILTVKESLGN